MMPASFLIAVTQTILNNLIPLTTHQISLAWGLQGDLRKLHRMLTTIQALVHDADKGRIESETMKEWLKSLQDVTSDAENVLDEFAYEALRRKIELRNRMRNKVRNFFSPSNALAFRLKMANKVNDVNLLLDEICKQAHDIGLRPAAQLVNAIVEPIELFRMTVPFVDDSNIVGRDRDVSAVIDMLLGSKIRDDLSVVAIVGMARVGKTTLAQLVYKSMEVVNNFDRRMWICVSEDFRVERLLNEMLQSLTREKSEIPNIEAIVGKIGEVLNEKKYLLVLDDVWNTNGNKWESIRTSLLATGGSKGSKILVTTRSMDVVSTMSASPSLTLRLSELSHDDSWAMFRKRAFVNGGPIETQNLVDIGRSLVEKCKGLPLAIKTLGGLLYSKKCEHQWVSIENSEIWSLPENEILPTLRLSFDHLEPASLKHCFAYCSLFPQDAEIKKDELVQLWMGLGYLQPSSGRKMEMEDVGDDYFNILVRNSLLQDIQWDEYNRITSCKMHDLVRDLALHVSKVMCLTAEISEVKDHSQVQHSTIPFREGTSSKIPKENLGKLRALFLTGITPENFADIKGVRALGGVEKLPSSKCIHLRYLDLSKRSIAKLPNFVTKLYNLQTLRLPELDNPLPKNFHRLVSLRHFYLSDMEINRKRMPMMVGQLTELQTLPFFAVGNDKGHKIEELGSLSQLRGKLKIYNLELVKDRDEAKKANIFGKLNIYELRFHWDHHAAKDTNHSTDEDVLEGLQPHRNIKGLILENFWGISFASWMRSNDASLLQNLVKIELRDCRRSEQVPTLGHLPHLKVVQIVGFHSLKRIGPEFYGRVVVEEDGSVVGSSCTRAAAAAVFPVLRELSLCDMPNLEEWSDISPSFPANTRTTFFFPCVEDIYILDCPQLITIPLHLLSVQELTIQAIWSDPYITERKKMYIPCLTIKTSLDSRIDVFLEDLLDKSSNSNLLRKLIIDGLKFSTYLPSGLKGLASLEELVVNFGFNLMSISKETEAISSGLVSLQRLLISHCPLLTCLPKWLLVPTLMYLDVDFCENLIMADPDEFCDLTSLHTFKGVGCPKLASGWMERLLLASSLRVLEIEVFSVELQCLLWQQNHCRYPLISLESLTLWGWRDGHYLPDKLQHLTALKELSILHFRLEALPEWLGNLSSLQSLEIKWCSYLMCLPSREAMQRLTNLRSLTTDGCISLVERCKRGSGQEWYKIAHIPYSDIN